MSSASSSLAATTAAIASPTKRTCAVGQDRLADRLVVELVQHRRDLLHAVKIGGGDHHRAVRRDDALNFAGGDRAAHEAHPMRGGQVGGEAALAGDQRRVFDAADGAADPFQPSRLWLRLVGAVMIATCVPARGAPRRAPDRAGRRRRSGGLRADRPRQLAASAAARKAASFGAWPLSAASASGMRRGEGSAPPTPTRASAILPPSSR